MKEDTVRYWILSMILLWVGKVGAAEVVNVDADNPPFMYEQAGKPVGLYPALLSAVFRKMGEPVLLQARPWQRALHELDRGRAGMGGIYWNPQRAQQYDYSASLYKEKIQAFFRCGEVRRIIRADDFRNLRVGVVRGWSYGEDFDRARAAGLFSVEETPSDRQNLMKLNAARVDVVLAVVEARVVLQRQIPGLKISAVPYLESPTYLVFAKSARKKAFLQRFNQALAELRASGEYDRIVATQLASLYGESGK